jgi:hypothetical protein
MLESRGATLNGSLSKPPLFDKGIKGKDGSQRDGSQSSKQQNFTFAEDTITSKRVNSVSGSDSLMKDSI